LLLLLMIACALGVVTSQHKARKLFVAWQDEKERAQQMDVEWGKLQLEQSTLVSPARVERIARQQLQMQEPAKEQIRYLYTDAKAGAAALHPLPHQTHSRTVSGVRLRHVTAKQPIAGAAALHPLPHQTHSRTVSGVRLRHVTAKQPIAGVHP
jgi:cell division protein FtsL